MQNSNIFEDERATDQDREIADVIRRLQSGDISMPKNFKIDCSTHTPLELRNGFSFGRECFGWYSSGWMEAAIAYLLQQSD